MLETIRRVKPTYVVGENVAGLVSMENGKTLDRILSDLEDEGYTTEQVIIPACAVGAWHRRDRIWIIAHNVMPTGVAISRNKLGGKTFSELGNDSYYDANPKYEGLEGYDGDNSSEHRKDKGIQFRAEGSTAENRETIGNPGSIRLQGSLQTGKHEEQNGCCEQGETACKYLHNDRHRIQSAKSTVKSSVGGVVTGLPPELDGYWDKEPEGVPRVSSGVKNRVDRLKGLGNAIVPQVAFEVFKAIEQYELSLPR